MGVCGDGTGVAAVNTFTSPSLTVASRGETFGTKHFNTFPLFSQFAGVSTPRLRRTWTRKVSRHNIMKLLINPKSITCIVILCRYLYLFNIFRIDRTWSIFDICRIWFELFLLVLTIFVAFRYLLWCSFRA